MNILIIDDNRLVLELLKRHFEEAGHAATTAEDGYLALDMLAGFIPDAIFIDLVMPRIDGDKLCRILRQMPEFDGCRLVLMSGAAAEVEVDLDAIGVDMFMAKGSTGATVRNAMEALDRMEETRVGERVPDKEVGTAGLPQRRITLELLGRRDHLETVLNTIFNGVVEIESGTIVYANTAAIYLLGGRPMYEILNTRFLGHFSPDARDAVDGFLSAPGDDTPSATADPVFPLKDRMVMLRKVARPDGAASQIVVLIDVTEMAHAEEELKTASRGLEDLVIQRRAQLESVNAHLSREIDARKASTDLLWEDQDRFDRFMRHLPSAAFIKNDLGQYVYLNQAFQDQFGVSAEHSQGRRDLDLWDDPQTAEQMMRNDHPVLSHREIMSTLEVLQLQDRTLYLLVTKFPILRDRGGPMVGGLAIDISRRKNLEDERYELQQQILRTRKTDAIGLLAGQLVHDLNNMMAGITSYPDFLLSTQTLPSAARRKLEIIKQAGDSAAEMMQDVLHLAGGDLNDPVPVQINDILALRLQQTQVRWDPTLAVRIRVEVALDPSLPEVYGVKELLAKAFDRLLAYATVHVGEGGGEILLQTATLRLETPITGYQHVPAGEYASVSMTVNGPLLSEEDCERAFEPFYMSARLGRSDCGLWLPVVWGVVMEHHGFINARQTPEGNNRFDLYFPVPSRVD